MFTSALARIYRTVNEWVDTLPRPDLVEELAHRRRRLKIHPWTDINERESSQAPRIGCRKMSGHTAAKRHADEMKPRPILRIRESRNIVDQRADRTVFRPIAIAVPAQFKRDAMIAVADLEADKIEGARGKGRAMQEEGDGTIVRPIEVAEANA